MEETEESCDALRLTGTATCTLESSSVTDPSDAAMVEGIPSTSLRYTLPWMVKNVPVEGRSFLQTPSNTL